jgi:hypothetical protein
MVLIPKGNLKDVLERAEKRKFLERTCREVSTWPIWKLNGGLASQETIEKAQERDAQLDQLDFSEAIESVLELLDGLSFHEQIRVLDLTRGRIIDNE